MVEDDIIARIDSLCEKMSISKYRLSKMTGISQSALSKMFQKQNTLSLATIERICKAFDMSLAQFFSFDDDYPNLTPRQKQLLALWSSLEQEKQEFILQMMKEIRKI